MGLLIPSHSCWAVGCHDAIESHKRYSPVDRLIHMLNKDRALNCLQ